MERLTKRNIHGVPYYPECFDKCAEKGPSIKCHCCYFEHEIIIKLAEYEDLEEQGRLIKLPISVENVIDKLFSHNEIVALWCKVEKDVTYHKLVWRGMAWDIPKKFKSCGFVKFFGTIPQNISQADTINIEVLLTEKAEKALTEMED